MFLHYIVKQEIGNRCFAGHNVEAETTVAQALLHTSGKSRKITQFDIPYMEFANYTSDLYLEFANSSHIIFLKPDTLIKPFYYKHVSVTTKMQLRQHMQI